MSDTGSSALPISVIILTKNEEAAIQDCLDAVRDFDDVHVVDSASDDATVDLAHRAGAHVVPFTWNGAYPKKKQWSLSNVRCRNEWVLLLDADERPTPQLVAEIRRLTQPGATDLAEFGAFDIPMLYEWQGSVLRHGHKVVKRSLLHRQRCRFPEVDDLQVATMWEVEGHYQPQTEHPVGRTRHPLHHRDPDPLHQWFSRHNRYSDWEAHLRLAGESSSVRRHRSAQGRLFDRLPAKPLLFFLYAYVVRAGFLDGRPGFDYAMAQCFYYWQISAKLRELRTAGGSGAAT